MEHISVRLSIGKKSYKSGSHIHGSVFLSVPKEATGCNHFSGIFLSLNRKETIDFQSTVCGTTWPKEQYESSSILIDKEIVHFTSPLVAGEHEYPFCLELPEESLPGSMCCSSAFSPTPDDLSHSSTCQLNYNLKAYLPASTAEPVMWPVKSCELPIHINASGNSIHENSTSGGTVVEPKMFKIHSWLSKKGFIELGLDTDIKVVSPGSKLTVCITGRNLSSVPVEGLLVQWIETVQWGKYSGHRRESHRILAENTVTINNLPRVWQPKRNIKSKRGRVSSAINPDELSTIDTDRIITHLHLKKDARDSYKGQMIQVHHALQVTVLTKQKNTTNPKITTLMELHRQEQPDDELSNSIVMAQAHLLTLPEDGTNSNEMKYHKGQDGIEIPIAVALNVSIDDDPVVQEKVEQNQSCLYDSCYLLVEKRNKPAIRLYEKLGYFQIWQDDTATKLLSMKDGELENSPTAIVCMKKSLELPKFGWFSF